MGVLIRLKQLGVASAANSMVSGADRMVCQIIEGLYSVEEQSPQDMEYFDRVAYYSYLGIKSFHLGQYEEAISHFGMAMKEKGLMDLEDNTNSHNDDSDEEEHDF